MKPSRPLKTLFASLLLTVSGITLATSSTDNASEECPSITNINQITQDKDIQAKLKQAFENNACFEADANLKGDPLSDGIVGPITKTWITRYLSDYGPDANANQSENSVDENLRPYVLTDDDILFFTLNSKVLPALLEISDKRYATPTALNQALDEALTNVKGMTDTLKTEYLDQIESLRKNQKVLQVSSSSLQTLIADGMTDYADALKPIQGVPVASAQFSDVVKNLLAAVDSKQAATNKEAAKAEKDAAKAEDKDKESDKKDDKNSDKKDSKDDGSDSKSDSKKDDTSKTDTSTSDKTKSTSDSGKTSSGEQLAKALNIVTTQASEAPNTAYFIGRGLLTEQQFPSIDEEVLTCVSVLKDMPFATEMAFQDALENLLDKVSWLQKGNTLKFFVCKIKATDKPVDVEQTTNILLARGTKSFYADNLQAIKMKPTQFCMNCALPFKGVTYGFYPFWFASDAYKNLGVPTVNPLYTDFSLFTRMGYYALPIGTDGKIKDELHFGDTGDIKGFVKRLTQYNVARDITLYSNTWHQWGAGKGTYDAQQTVYGYAETHLKQIITYHNQLKKFGGLSGITVFFDHYDGTMNAANIKSYMTELKTQIYKGYLAGNNPNFNLNLMLSIDWKYDSEGFCQVKKRGDKQTQYFNAFSDLLLSTAENKPLQTDLQEVASGAITQLENRITDQSQLPPKPYVDNLLVFINEPTGRSKKCLRLQVENEFYGDQRIDVLRMIVPIINRAEMPEAGDDALMFLQNDISYLQDNFGGMGFWPLAASTSTDTKDNTGINYINDLNQILTEQYQQEYKNYLDFSKLGLAGQALHNPYLTDNGINICGYACPQRRYAKYVFLLFFLASAGLWIAYQVNCKARKRINKIRWLSALIKLTAVALFVIMLGCDPTWQAMSMQIIGVVLIPIIVYLVYRLFYVGEESAMEE